MLVHFLLRHLVLRSKFIRYLRLGLKEEVTTLDIGASSCCGALTDDGSKALYWLAFAM